MFVTANVLQPLIDVFESVLKFFHNTGGISWGWSIVLLTIAVRALLVPLTLRQIKGMVRMQSFAPQMKEIQAKYKQDKQRQQEEMMKFYKANNINPLASCLPLVLQLPVFVSLYFMLRKSLRSDICPAIQQKFQETYAHAHHLTSVAAASGQTTACGPKAAGAHFLFISDLTAKATGVTLGILIVLYVGSQIGSTLVMSTANVDPNQRRIMMVLPLVFVLFVIRFPAGLLVYWITTNLWTVAQQYVVKRRVGPAQAATAAAAAAAGGSSGSGGGGSGGSGGSGGGGPDGGRSSGGGGLGARLRERLAEQTDSTQTSRAGRGNGAGSGSGTATKPATKPARTGSARRGSGATNGAGKSNGSSAGDGGDSAAPGAPPPRPPRKRKKRSGRRR
jgi:YidC/Oxa1 family membrane protein insertase